MNLRIVISVLWMLLQCRTSTAFSTIQQQRSNYATKKSTISMISPSADTTTNSNNEKDLNTIIAEQKKTLFKAVGKGNRVDILNAAKELEIHNRITSPVSGRWLLVFSTMSSEDTPLDGVLRNLADDSLPMIVSNTIYKTLFRFLPALAGGQDQEDKKSVPWKVANEQIVDTKKGTVDNTVDIRFDGDGPSVRIRVRGTAKPIGDNENLLEIIFTESSIGPIPPTKFPPTLKVPLPRPVGNIRTTFCDNDLRLSRGGRGGIFVLKRFGGK